MASKARKAQKAQKAKAKQQIAVACAGEIKGGVFRAKDLFKISSNSVMKKSQQRGFRKNVIQSYLDNTLPSEHWWCFESSILDRVLPLKRSIGVCSLQGGQATLYTVLGVPLWFSHDKTTFYPTLFCLWQLSSAALLIHRHHSLEPASEPSPSPVPDKIALPLPQIVLKHVDVWQFLQNGADLMAPGVRVPHTLEIQSKFEKGSLVTAVLLPTSKIEAIIQSNVDQQTTSDPPSSSSSSSSPENSESVAEGTEPVTPLSSDPGVEQRINELAHKKANVAPHCGVPLAMGLLLMTTGDLRATEPKGKLMSITHLIGDELFMVGWNAAVKQLISGQSSSDSSSSSSSSSSSQDSSAASNAEAPSTEAPEGSEEGIAAEGEEITVVNLGPFHQILSTMMPPLTVSELVNPHLLQRHLAQIFLLQSHLTPCKALWNPEAVLAEIQQTQRDTSEAIVQLISDIRSNTISDSPDDQKTDQNADQPEAKGSVPSSDSPEAQDQLLLKSFLQVAKTIFKPKDEAKETPASSSSSSSSSSALAKGAAAPKKVPLPGKGKAAPAPVPAVPSDSAPTFPISSSTFYSAFMIPNRPRSSTLNIKLSTHKKLAKFLKYLEKEQLIKTKPIGGDVHITSIRFEHPLIQAYQPYKVKKETSSSSADEEDESEMSIRKLYKVPKLLRPLFQHLTNPHDGEPVSFVNEKQVADSLRQYISAMPKPEGVEVPSDSVSLDEVLRPSLFPSLFPGSIVTKRDLSLKLVEKILLHYSITREGVTQVKKGAFPSIEIEVIDRTKRKSCTYVRGFESFMIFPEDAVNRIKSILATSCSLTREYDLDSTLPFTTALVIQGDFSSKIQAFLREHYQIPASCLKIKHK